MLADEFGRTGLLAAHELVGERTERGADDRGDDVEPKRVQVTGDERRTEGSAQDS
jgi:hypothetical protein